MNPFLKQIAEKYIENEYNNLLDYCFVFPNKRSGVFFRNYLTTLAAGKPLLMPQIITIDDLMSSLSPLAEASRLDRLFLLYNEYSKLSNEIAEFDKFMFWGEMILADFDDVDQNLADAGQLFKNLKRYREISSYYLTPEQEEILSRYWGGQFVKHSPDEFWSHLKEDNAVEQKFLKLWEVLAPLYVNYQASLRKEGLGSHGMIVRDAVAMLNEASREDLPFRRYIFVGFNVLSLAEIRIMERMKSLGIADFYWDMPSGVFSTQGNKAVRFMMRNVKLFPSLYQLETPVDNENERKIKIIGVPSGVGQTKDAGRTLDEWIDKKVIPDPSNAIRTALVLPDESLFIPMTHAVPEKITALNVTMGFPIRATSFAAFISSIVSLQLRAQRSGDDWFFFHEDVNSLVSHPLLRDVDSKGCDDLLRTIRDRRLFLVPEKEIFKETPSLAPFFKVISDSDSVEEVYHYFHTILSTLLYLLSGEKDKADDDKDKPREKAEHIETYFVRSYLDALDELKSAIDRRKIKMKDITFIQLLQKAIASTSVNFTGEPLKGLQMMGVLETRALDFDNIIILSMNENIFPRKLYSRSFIPENLRRSYGLPTSDYQDSIFSYTFYRLLSRASNVVLYYDARNVSGRNSEMSRYISQLVYLFPDFKVEHELVTYTMPPISEDVIAIPKTPEIMAKLKEFTPEGGTRTLSASSINDYINCPLSFYLKRLCRLDLDETVIDYMDAGTYGSILHAIAERIYNGFLNGATEVKVTAEMLDHVLKSGNYLDRIITKTINEIFNKLGPDCDNPLTGEARVLGVVMKHFITMMIREEKKMTPFDFIAAEYTVEQTLKISDDLSINIRQIIDRIDRVYPDGHYGEDTLGLLRIVDYKTGEDNISFVNFDQLFSNLEKSRRKAIVQLLFYCNAYASHSNYSGPIMPMIYQMKTLSTLGLRPLTFNKKYIRDYHEINDGFLDRFNETIKEMFDPAVPFTQAPSNHNCKFCSLTSICRRK